MSRESHNIYIYIYGTPPKKREKKKVLNDNTGIYSALSLGFGGGVAYTVYVYIYIGL